MVAAWLFAIASLIAGLGILFAFKRLMRGLSYRIERNEFDQQALQKDQTRYFIQVALLEAVPIFLLILGFTFMEDTEVNLASIAVPVVVIVGVILFSAVQIWSVKQEVLSNANINSTEKSYINSISFIGLATVMGIPIISTVCIILML